MTTFSQSAQNYYYKNAKSATADTQLQMQLSRLNKETKNEMRMHNNEIQRFKKKYSKLDIYNDNPIVEASDIRMYETHIPGFCYKSNGECRCPPVVIPDVFVNFHDIHSLLFTNDEVDIEKMLCLHLLCYHRTEWLNPPPKRYNFFLPKKMSPMERLIERSKKKIPPEYSMRQLPIYVVDTGNPTNSKNGDIHPVDQRLASKVLVNEKLLEIIYTVFNSLHQTNIRKFMNLVKLAKNEKFIKDILTSAKTKQFAIYLKELQMITSCEAFKITTIPIKKKIHKITMRNAVFEYEDLLKYIRKNLFQLSESSVQSSKSFKASEVAKDSNLKDYSDDNLSLELELSSQRLDIKDNDYGLEMSQSLERFCCEDETIVNRPANLRISKREIREAQLTNFLPKFDEVKEPKQDVNKDLKQSLALSPKVSEDVLEITDRSDLVKIAHDLNKKVKELAKRDRKLSNLFYFDHGESKREESENVLRVPQKGSNHRLLRCAACQHKWQIPSPLPKVSNIKKVYMPTLTEETYNEIKTHSLHKISQMIDRGFVRSKERKVSESGAVQSSSSSVKNRFFCGCSTEVVQLKDVDLATIKQEIKEKEAKRKYEKFFQKA